MGGGSKSCHWGVVGLPPPPAHGIKCVPWAVGTWCDFAKRHQMKSEGIKKEQSLQDFVRALQKWIFEEASERSTLSMHRVSLG